MTKIVKDFANGIEGECGGWSEVLSKSETAMQLGVVCFPSR